jgi:hypothetical protein
MQINLIIILFVVGTVYYFRQELQELLRSGRKAADTTTPAQSESNIETTSSLLPEDNAKAAETADDHRVSDFPAIFGRAKTDLDAIYLNVQMPKKRHDARFKKTVHLRCSCCGRNSPRCRKKCRANSLP